MRPPLMSLMSTRPLSLLRPPTVLEGGFLQPLIAMTNSEDENNIVMTSATTAVVREQHVVVGAVTAAKRPRMKEAARLRSMVVLGEIATEYLQEAPALIRIAEEDGTVKLDTPSFVAMLTRKSSGTLSKRASSLRMYRAWFRSTSATPATFLTENMIFKYFHSLFVDGAPATRAASLREAVKFLQGIFEINLSSIRQSSRVLGMAVQLLRSKVETNLRKPITVPMVLALEMAMLESTDLKDNNLMIAGVALLGVFGRVRVGDMRRCAIEPQADLIEDSHIGYVETRFLEHKTARPGTSRALPMAAPAFGLCTTGSWGARWLEARAAQGLDAARQKTLIPALADDS